MDENLMRQIWAVYHSTGSLHKTAEEMGFAYAKVRKALITYGAYSTRFSDDVYYLRCKGYSVEEIAKELNTSVKRVSAWLPYEKNMYNLAEKSQEAVRCDNYRKRNEKANENFISNKFSNDEKGRDDMGRWAISYSKLMEEERNKAENAKKQAEPIRLHLKLFEEYLDEDEQRTLKKYGRSSTGNSIERDILIPPDMTLHALHYAILRLYGWQNGHLHSFHLPEELYKKLTNNTVRGWGDLIGVLFQTVYPDNVWKIRYGDDDYKNGSIKTWLRKKYTGPYRYLGLYEKYEVAVGKFDELTNEYQNMAVYKPYDFNNPKRSREDKVVKYAPIIDLTLDEMNASIIIDSTDELLERLTVSSLLAYSGMKTVSADELGLRMIKRDYKVFGEVEEPEVKPITEKLFYHYDYGDGWVVEITREKDCDDLIKEGFLTDEELIEARNTVTEKYKPVCIHQDGICLVDDVGGFSGFIDMLRILYEQKEDDEPADPYDPDRKENTLRWASGMGWSARKVSNKQML